MSEKKRRYQVQNKSLRMFERIDVKPERNRPESVTLREKNTLVGSKKEWYALCGMQLYSMLVRIITSLRISVTRERSLVRLIKLV